MSENEAVRRIEAARLVKRFPALLGHIERGELHLTALLELRRELTQGNASELVAAVRGKTEVEIQLLAARAPKPDVMANITPLPQSSLPSPQKVASPLARMELAPTRHRLELTISDDVRAKLERARDLLGHTLRSQDLESVLERALDALLAKLEKTRVGDVVSHAVRREVFERDGEQCTFTDVQGNRCSSRARLELDHILPRALGGTDDAANLRVVCQAHNRLYAEQSSGASTWSVTSAFASEGRAIRYSTSRGARSLALGSVIATFDAHFATCVPEMRASRCHRCGSSFERRLACSHTRTVGSIILSRAVGCVTSRRLN